MFQVNADLDPENTAEVASYLNKLSEHAYAPYSGIRIAALVQDERKLLFAGVNVENAAYPQGTCAEAGAIANLIASGGKQITQVWLVRAEGKLATPCGGCRQKILEFADKNCLICCLQHGQICKQFNSAQLLPDHFIY